MSRYLDDQITSKLQMMSGGNSRYPAGKVVSVKDYMLVVKGISDVACNDIVEIEDKAEGYVDSIGRNDIRVALTKVYQPIQVDDTAILNGKEFRMQFSPDSIGHVVDIFGTDCLSGRRFEHVEELMIETPAISIMERAAVRRPLETGIAGIDLLYPIGKGQRQLIIGDKKTGKSQIGLDTIVNQRDKNVLCIYIAVGKTKKEVKELFAQLLQRGAMEYSIILAAFGDQCPPVLKNTPSAGLSVAERYMRQGRDVLVVMDDLKRHADCCREIALMGGKVPGRDAYPPDIFFSHASLLEKGCQYGTGGSITILPICETKGGDITDYIATNLISITDGQLVMSKKSFDQGQKPAINYGLSVSRLGGAVQTKDMKRIGTATRRELLSYLEIREVFELANLDEMGESMRRKLTNGKELLKKLRQDKYSPKSHQTMMEEFYI